ncbi:MAG: NAD-dependent epimerase/dehydratase family protein [Bacteroidetes bacterium]|nr:MAG: NAD-dependent epimerase/dehydratase family protein [Bacteroidota bacterium]
MKIKAIITGTTGMVGKGVLLECLESPDVESVLIINRRSIGMQHPKLTELIHADFDHPEPLGEALKGYNACFFCLGISSVGMSDEDYYRITYTLTTRFAQVLLENSPDLTFCYVSGTGTDSTETSRMNWANVKGKTENALLAMPFKTGYMFRPGIIQPLKGVKAKSGFVNFMYFALTPLVLLMRAISPKLATTSVNIGRAMINAVLRGYDKSVLENGDINKLAG